MNEPSIDGWLGELDRQIRPRSTEHDPISLPALDQAVVEGEKAVADGAAAGDEGAPAPQGRAAMSVEERLARVERLLDADLDRLVVALLIDRTDELSKRVLVLAGALEQLTERARSASSAPGGDGGLHAVLQEVGSLRRRLDELADAPIPADPAVAVLVRSLHGFGVRMDQLRGSVDSLASRFEGMAGRLG